MDALAVECTRHFRVCVCVSVRALACLRVRAFVGDACLRSRVLPDVCEMCLAPACALGLLLGFLSALPPTSAEPSPTPGRWWTRRACCCWREWWGARTWRPPNRSPGNLRWPEFRQRSICLVFQRLPGFYAVTEKYMLISDFVFFSFFYTILY